MPSPICGASGSGWEALLRLLNCGARALSRPNGDQELESAYRLCHPNAVLLRYTGHAVSPHHAYARWAPAAQCRDRGSNALAVFDGAELPTEGERQYVNHLALPVGFELSPERLLIFCFAVCAPCERGT